MGIKKLITASLADALKKMDVGETCYAPDGYSEKNVRKECALLKKEGFIFLTSITTGTQTVTRLK